MSSTFSGIYIANSGLHASQTALNTTGHNITNLNTDGYTRQRANQVDMSYLSDGQYKIGTGTKIDEIQQMRSIFLDKMYRDEESSLGYWQAKQSTINDIQTVMNDLSDDETMQDALDNFFNAWDELSQDPSSASVRASVTEYGNSLAEMFNEWDKQLGEMQKNLDSQIQSMVKDINSIGEQAAELNQKIANAQANGDNANDYIDEMNSLLDTLSEYADIKVSTGSNGMHTVSIGGVNLVNGTASKELTCETNSSNGTFSTVVWKATGAELNLNDGMLLGLIESRGDVVGGDGSTTNGSPVESTEVDTDSDSYNFTGESENTISELRTGLNMLVSLLARKVNEMHSSGEGLDGSTGVNFFVKIDGNLPFEIGNIQVNPELQDDTDKIAASSAGGDNDGDIASEISDFSDTEYFTNDGLKMNVSDFYSALVDWVGTKGEEAEGYATNQDTLVTQAETKRQTLSGVSQDEELTNLIQFQHAYNASARVMNMIDSMLDTVINNMGVAGR